jgi:hypothetical protein
MNSEIGPNNGAQPLSALVMLIPKQQKPSMTWHLGWTGNYSCLNIPGFAMVRRQCQAAGRWLHKSGTKRSR